jgi:hypothetical protein
LKRYVENNAWESMRQRKFYIFDRVVEHCET